MARSMSSGAVSQAGLISGWSRAEDEESVMLPRQKGGEDHGGEGGVVVAVGGVGGAVVGVVAGVAVLGQVF